MNRFTKVDDRNLTDALIAFDHKTVDNSFDIPCRIPFKPDERISLSFEELVMMVSTAREFGVMEASEAITQEYLRSIGLFPLYEDMTMIKSMKEGKPDNLDADRWVSI
ncbi:MAG: hypothetical protein VXW65_03565 [Pseudomonadota bacterium]|nr:hypothetical protein [Pseudomonadota bacterium]